MINRISNIQVTQNRAKLALSDTRPLNKDIFLIKGLATTDSVSFGKTPAKNLVEEIITAAQEAKKIRFEELTPTSSDIFMAGNKYSIDEFPSTPPIIRLKKDAGGNGIDISIVDTNKENYKELNDSLRQIAIPQILQRKGFKQNNLAGLIEELKERLNLDSLKFLGSYKEVQNGQKVKKSAYYVPSDAKNSSVNFVKDAQNNPPRFYKIELVDHNGYSNSFHLKNDAEIELAKPFFKK